MGPESVVLSLGKPRDWIGARRNFEALPPRIDSAVSHRRRRCVGAAFVWSLDKKKPFQEACVGQSPPERESRVAGITFPSAWIRLAPVNKQVEVRRPV